MRLSLLFAAGAVIALAAVAAASIWVSTVLAGDVSGLGWLAYGLGAGLSLAVGGGLFFLTFYSARHGYDDLDRDSDTDPWDPGPRDD